VDGTKHTTVILSDARRLRSALRCRLRRRLYRYYRDSYYYVSGSLSSPPAESGASRPAHDPAVQRDVRVLVSSMTRALLAVPALWPCYWWRAAFAMASTHAQPTASTLLITCDLEIVSGAQTHRLTETAPTLYYSDSRDVYVVASAVDSPAAVTGGGPSRPVLSMRADGLRALRCRGARRHPPDAAAVSSSSGHLLFVMHIALTQNIGPQAFDAIDPA